MSQRSQKVQRFSCWSPDASWGVPASQWLQNITRAYVWTYPNGFQVRPIRYLSPGSEECLWENAKKRPGLRGGKTRHNKRRTIRKRKTRRHR